MQTLHFGILLKVSSSKPEALLSPLETKVYFGVLPLQFQGNVQKLVDGAALQGCEAENEALTMLLLQLGWV